MVTFSGKEKIERMTLSQQQYVIDSTNKEIVVILLSGAFEIASQLFEREDVFSQDAQGFYFSNSGACELKILNEAEICFIEHESKEVVPYTTIQDGKIITKIVGHDNFLRKVTTLVDSKSGLENLIIGETFKKRGNWSSWPPHKHDTYLINEESAQKEVYLYKFKESGGFGIQVIYEENVENATVQLVTNNKEVKIEKGYHPVVASPHSEMYYLWALFGDNSFFKVGLDRKYTK